jgi:rSAM/selenodomain-associated transferase 1
MSPVDTRKIDGVIIVMAKSPVPGRVKTRLCPPLTPEQAAQVARAALEDTLDAVQGCHADRKVLALDGDLAESIGGAVSLPDGMTVIEQRSGGLDQRLAGAFDDVGERGAIIAMDTPQVTPTLLDAALVALHTDDTALGPTPDGGYWTIALADPGLDVIRGVPMSAPHTYAEQVARIAAAGVSLAVLPELVDVDDVTAAAAVSEVIPNSRFGRLIAEFSPFGPYRDA